MSQPRKKDEASSAEWVTEQKGSASAEAKALKAKLELLTEENGRLAKLLGLVESYRMKAGESPRWLLPKRKPEKGTATPFPLSAGHCAAVAVVFYRLTGGEFVSTTVGGQSHWFNRVKCGCACLDIDLTGDQFKRPEVQVAPAGTLYPLTRVRSIDELRDETLIRAELLMDRLLRNEPPGAA